MRRWVFNLVALVSLAVLLVVVVFWVRSYLGLNVWLVPWRGTLLVAGVDRDEESLRAEIKYLNETPVEWMREIRRSGVASVSHEFLGFGYFRAPAMCFGRPTYELVILAIPYWAMAVLAGVK